jgi:hypothetical protein
MSSSNFESEQPVEKIAPGCYEFVTQVDGSRFWDVTQEGVKAPIEILAHFTDSPQQYAFTHDEDSFNPDAWGGVGIILFYKSIDTPRGLVVKLTNENFGNDHYLTEVRAGKRLANPDNIAFASLFVVALNPNDGNQSKILRFPVRHDGGTTDTKFTVTVMERAKMPLHYMVHYKRVQKKLKAKDLAVIITFIEKVYCTLEGTGYFYKDMKLDQILCFGDVETDIIEDQLKLGDLGNLCETSAEDEYCKENLGVYVPAPAMQLSLDDALLWQKYLIICMLVLDKDDRYNELFDSFMSFGEKMLTDETFRKVHSKLLCYLRLETPKMQKIDNLMALEYSLFQKAMHFFEGFSEPMEAIDFTQFGQ